MKKNYKFTFKTLTIKVTSFKNYDTMMEVRFRATDNSTNENGLATVYIERNDNEEIEINNFENEVKDFFNDYFNK